MRALVLAIVFLLIASPALCDPCTAKVTGYKPGATVAGTMRYYVDGDSLCLSTSPDPKTWTEIRLADFYAPELSEPGGRQAKAALERLTKGKRLVCTATRGTGGRTYSYDRLIAVCTLDGVSVGDRLRRAGGVEGGRGK